MTKLLVKKLHPDAILPTKKHALDAGVDLYFRSDVHVPPYSTVTIPLGISVSLPPGTYGSFREKGSMAGLSPISLGGGVLDEGYTGELKLIVKNPIASTLLFRRGEAIAQLIIQPFISVSEVVDVDKLPEKPSERKGSGGVHMGPHRAEIAITDIRDIESEFIKLIE